MALKGTQKSKTSKTITSITIFLGTLAIGGVANMFWQLLARQTGFEGSTFYVAGAWTIMVIAALVALTIIYLVWPDASPEVIAAKKARDKKIAQDGAATPNFEAALARDKAAREAFMDEDDSDYLIDRTINEDDDYTKVGEAFNSDLARDMRARR